MAYLLLCLAINKHQSVPFVTPAEGKREGRGETEREEGKGNVESEREREINHLSTYMYLSVYIYMDAHSLVTSAAQTEETLWLSSTGSP